VKLSHTQLAHQIHADNIKAGWWSDLKTGDSIIHTRNRPEILMLIVRTERSRRRVAGESV